jgi:hypothetical protein
VHGSKQGPNVLFCMPNRANCNPLISAMCAGDGRCGSATTPYAQGLKDRLRAACSSSVIEERFLGAADLAQVRDGLAGPRKPA